MMPSNPFLDRIAEDCVGASGASGEKASLAKGYAAQMTTLSLVSCWNQPLAQQVIDGVCGDR